MTERFRLRVVPLHPGVVSSDYGVHEVGVTVCGVQHVVRVLGVRVRPGTRHFPYNENPKKALNTTSFKCCLPSTYAIHKLGKNSRMRKVFQGRLIQARFIEIHKVLAKKKSCNIFLTQWCF